MEADERAWPAMYIETRCDACGHLIIAEKIRPIVVEKWTAIMEHHKKAIVAHVEACPERPA